MVVIRKCVNPTVAAERVYLMKQFVCHSILAALAALYVTLSVIISVLAQKNDIYVLLYTVLSTGA